MGRFGLRRYSLAQGYLYTVEAFDSYLEHLTAGGMLTISRWMWSPPRELLKLFATAATALEARGVTQPGRHMAVVSNGPFGNLLVKHDPFTEQEMFRLATVMMEQEFSVHFAPVGTAGTAFHAWLNAADREQFYAAYPYDVRPATDDRPFFFELGKWQDASPFGQGWRDRPFVLSGRLVSSAVLIQACAFACVFVVLPIVWSSRRKRGLGGRLGIGVWTYVSRRTPARS